MSHLDRHRIRLYWDMDDRAAALESTDVVYGVVDPEGS